MGNECLTRAKEAKKDEFYTQLDDIEKELKHYTNHFRGKVVYCNCDDPYESSFFRHFILKFNKLGLKKLITTCYKGSPISGRELCLDANREAYKIEIDAIKDGAYDLDDIKRLLSSGNEHVKVKIGLKGGGDFRSEECGRLLKKADIVVTNPPFSLFREYVAQLVAFNKKFLIIGNQNAVSYKEIFPLIRENKIWLGNKSGAQKFYVPNNYEQKNVFLDKKEGKKKASFGNICWFTNLDIPKRHGDLILFEKYSPEKYPKYDNYDAIEVGQVAKIPCDYYGAMGVPVTVLDKYNPDQFEILGLDDPSVEWRGRGPDLNGKKLYRRIIIKRKNA